MKNSFVLLFSGDDHWWWVTDLHKVEHGWRGFVNDGCFWMDYHEVTQSISICVARGGTGISWDNPINTIKNRTLLETKPVTINSNDYLTIQRWAKNQKE